MRILAIDPGPVESGWVLYEEGGPIKSGVSENEELLRKATFEEGFYPYDVLVYEWIENMGMPAGKDVHETSFWCGQFVRAVRREDLGIPSARVTRRGVKLHLCGSMRAKDANVRQALLDRFGGKGTKKNPGPLYGIKSHAWSALAVAVTWLDQHKGKGDVSCN